MKRLRSLASRVLATASSGWGWVIGYGGQCLVIAAHAITGQPKAIAAL